uniref:RAB31, member RAS oncogene family n=1 Tax=Apteryx owenii TaxID=8824 RepID=A0A8B9QL76_APTOW
IMAFKLTKDCLKLNTRDTGVGKSSIVCRFVQDHFDHNISPTIGASFMTKTVPCGNELHKFLIWDTAGQERVMRGPRGCEPPSLERWACVKGRRRQLQSYVPAHTCEQLAQS